ncbi:uncharacterized protein LOC108630964 [Ceratina calcarata]|uniref:Uncharacterized protein LOC108630964 n=1 Tax=Ceratina calcarata TaxID=156304 RepID=A0AAJ7JCT9_9HYME|nr:uncharacterized protein LOC108630964 [Ceratina calcarata]
MTWIVYCSARQKILPDNMYKNGHQGTRPVKVLQLLKELESKKKSARKDSAHKRPMQPEKLLVSTSKKKEGGEENETRQFVKPGNCVRRVLNFNQPSGNATKNKCESTNKASRFEMDECIGKNSVKKVGRMSFIPLPNSTREKQLQKFNNKVNECSKITEMSKETDNTYDESANTRETNPVNESSDINVDRAGKTVNESVIINGTGDAQRSKMLNVRPEVLISQPEDLPRTTRNSKVELITETSERSEVHTEPKVKLDSVQNLCKNFQSKNLVTGENDTRTEDELSNVFRVERDNLISFQRYLENRLRLTEEHAIQLRASITCVASLITTLNDETNGLPDTKLQRECNTMVDKEVQTEICPEERSETCTKSILPPAELECLPEDDEGNKENEVLNTMRLSGVTTNSSFLELENELNIIHTEPSPDYENRSKTPIIKRYKQKSFREYMALKSSMSFLETPDGKRFRCLCQKNGTAEPDLNRKSISKKLLEDIRSLNNESADSDL